jgi:glutathione peroxidase-family protein
MTGRSICAFIIAVAVLAQFATPTPSLAAEFRCPTILDHKFANLMDEPISLCQFRGKVLLIVNTASECGYTPQYDGLEKLYRRYRDRGFAVLGFPANDFGGQEPGSNKEIAQFCRVNYGITFPIFAKTSSAQTQTRCFASLLSKPRSRRDGTFTSISSIRRRSLSPCSKALSSPKISESPHRSKNSLLRVDRAMLYALKAIRRPRYRAADRSFLSTRDRWCPAE